jgi:hypothetical protein
MPNPADDSKNDAGPAVPDGLAASHKPKVPRSHGYLGDDVPGLVPPSQRNQGDTGIASDQPEAGGELDFDDGTMWDRGNTARTGGTWAAQGADSAPLGAPAEIFSNSNQPSDQSDRPEGAKSDGETA